LSARLAPLGANLLIGTISQIADGTARPEKQNDSEATLAPILKKDDGRVDWSRTAQQIYNRMRGFNPWPGAFTTFRGQPLTIAWGKPMEHEVVPVSALSIEKRRVFAGCGEGTTLELLEVQPAGKRKMSAEAFLNGYKLKEGERLGDLLP
jgi:methionyl-tRNA formyltransferase